MLIDVCTRAIQDRSDVVDMERSARRYLSRLDLAWSAGYKGQHTLFRNHGDLSRAELHRLGAAASVPRRELRLATLSRDSGRDEVQTGTPVGDIGDTECSWPPSSVRTSSR